MKILNIPIIKQCLALPYLNLTFKAVILTIFLSIGVQTMAQTPQYARPSWWFGAAAGANFNFYTGTTRHLNSDFAPPVPFHDGSGIGLFLGGTIEYYRENSLFGFMLQGGLDSRRGDFDQVITPCNCPADLSTDLSYYTIEPSLRFAPFRSNFYIFGGPRFAFIKDQSFTYQLHKNPAYPNQAENPEVNGEIDNVKSQLISFQVGAGLDIPLSKEYKHTQVMISPFISYHPYMGQEPRSTETWSVSTLRIGASIKIGRGRLIKEDATTKEPVKETPTKDKPVVVAAVVYPADKFVVNSPANVIPELMVREIFPISNYIFFDLGSSEIPKRYVQLSKSEVKDFKEDQLKVAVPENLSGRSERQMTVYYNILNILGDRMNKNPASTITLVGSSEQSLEDGKAMAQSIKNYLMNTFGIADSRISIETRTAPKIPSQQPGGTEELKLLKEGDRRVSIESSSPALLMEFQSGPYAKLKPVEISGIQEPPIESYVSFNVVGGKDKFTSWSMKIKDDKNNVESFGPYSDSLIRIPGKTILHNNTEGTYLVTMTGKTANGREVVKDTTIRLNLWEPAEQAVGTRFSVIYEFNNSDAITMYEKYLTEIVMPKIPIGSTVIIRGYTDVIGDAENNQKLSLARANDVKRILQNALAKAGRSDVKFEVYGSGENPKLSPFDNKYPEGRAYNRSVIIDIVPAK